MGVRNTKGILGSDIHLPDLKQLPRETKNRFQLYLCKDSDLIPSTQAQFNKYSHFNPTQSIFQQIPTKPGLWVLSLPISCPCCPHSLYSNPPLPSVFLKFTKHSPHSVQTFAPIVLSARNASFFSPQVFLRFTPHCIHMIHLFPCVFIAFLTLDVSSIRTRNLFYPQLYLQCLSLACSRNSVVV